MWRAEKILGRGLCSSAIDFKRMNIEQPLPVRPHRRNDTCSESDVFKDVNKSSIQEFFAAARERMEAATIGGSGCNTPMSFDDQYINVPALSNTKKTHFDYDEVKCLNFLLFCQA